MKRKILIVVLVLAICVFGYKIDSLFKSVKSDALEQTQKTNVNILKMIEDSIYVCSVEYDYEDYITRRKTWVVGLNPSIKYAKFMGKIKVGCKIKSVKKESNIFSIVLSEPSVLEHEINRKGDWEGKEGTWNNFTPAEEGKVINEQKIIIENRLINELQQEDKKRNKELISNLLVKFNEKEDSFIITYVKK
ncbi:hypothetical protein [Clostridium lacusfryxellense]|uniref:hypothetical protein n=1 Tax=Clostridium lacusfryxellense TaxID=205328 RepID=UPI001C0D439A|nr:hypothetical protein [Clostridium lacusfryxellense]MBU3112706.1 hypothetical protein [Clostridium lacusfryxellense]